MPPFVILTDYGPALMKTAAILLPVGVLAHLPFVIPQMQWLWDSEHYGFFPFAIAAFCWLVWERLKDTKVTLGCYLSKHTICLLVFNILLLSLATLANSYWLGWVSFIMFLWTSAHILLPPESARLIRMPFLALLLIVPLPLNLDTSLVIQLQKLATRQGSLMLDYVGIKHAVSGVAIRLPERTFMIDDACSGIHSLFSAVTAMLVFSIYCRYSIWRTAFTVAQTVFWVLVVNSARVFVVVYTTNRWNIGLEDGWRHQALGFACYVAILMMSFSTDQFLRYIVRLRPEEVAERSRRGSSWSKLTAWFDAPFADRWARAAGLAFALLFLMVGGVAAAQSWRVATSVDADNFAEGLPVQLTEADLPADVNGWRRVAFKAENREAGNVLGMNSFIWTYERNGIVAQFSIDGAYPSFHDLYYCYSATGWKLQQSDNIPIGGTVGDTVDAVATELHLYQDDGKQAHVLFTCLDSAGHVVEPPAPAASFLRKLLDRLQSGQILMNEDEQVVPPVVQFQAFSNSQTEYFDSEREELRKLFSLLRSDASELLLEPAGGTQSVSLSGGSTRRN